MAITPALPGQPFKNTPTGIPKKHVPLNQQIRLIKVRFIKTIVERLDQMRLLPEQ